MMNFYDWINKKYFGWEVMRGERGSVTGFAQYVGVPQTTMSAWMKAPPNNRIPRDTESINKLARRFGDEVYSVLGFELKEDKPLSEAPPWLRDEFTAAVSEANQAYRAAADAGRRLSEEEALSIIRESMAKHGFSETSSENVNPANEK